MIAGALAHGLIDASYALPDLILIWVLVGYLPLLRLEHKISAKSQ
jgi:hypothetical protein